MKEVKTRWFWLIFYISISIIGNAKTYSYQFNSLPLSQAIERILKNHPNLKVNFIYNELENYRTSSIVSTDDPYEALRLTIGLNPVSVLRVKDTFYIEALQHGKYIFSGRITGSDEEPVIAASIMLLSPKDSCVLTYGVADLEGRFSIPCDHSKVVAKISSIGFKTNYIACKSLNLGTIRMQENVIKLSEIKIEGDNTHIYSDKSSFIPTKRQKNSSQDAVMLLSLMSIPQLDVDLVDNTVRTIQGQDVSIFIDYIPASEEDLAGMLTQDVKKVEYLINPSDSRFHGERYVLNFVMQKYQWGGYTKFMAYKNFGKNSAKASVYSKMNYKKMMFDVYADEYYKSLKHNGQISKEEFNFSDTDYDGTKICLREETPLDSRYLTNRNNISLRAVYNTEKIQVSNRLSAYFTHTPHNDISSELSVSPSPSLDLKTFSKVERSEKGANYYLDLFSPFSNSLSFSMRGWYLFGRNHYSSRYSVENGFVLYNAANETSNHFQLYPTLNWTFNNKHNFTIVAGTVHNWNVIDYYGNSPSRQTFNIGGYGIDAGYQFNLQKFTVGADFGWFWQTNRISGFKIKNDSPQINFFVSYSPNFRHQIRGSFFYGEEIPSAFQKSPNMLRQDELMYYCGNPGLRDFSKMNSNLSYIYVPDNRWKFTLEGYFNVIKNACVPIFSPKSDEDVMIRQYFNNGIWRKGGLKLNASGSFFNGSLTAKIQPQLQMSVTDGEYAWKHNQFSCKIELNYFLGDFYFIAWYKTPEKFQADNGVIISCDSRYQLKVGWSHGSWNVSAYAFNPFKTSWIERKESLKSPYYNYQKRILGDNAHFCYNITVNYYFGYGKKVNHRDEVGGAEIGSSAILK